MRKELEFRSLIDKYILENITELSREDIHYKWKEAVENIKQIAFRSKRALEELNLQMQYINEASGSVGDTVNNIKLSINKAKQHMANILHHYLL